MCTAGKGSRCCVRLPDGCILLKHRKAKVFCLSKINGFVSHTCVLVHCPHLRWFWMWHSRHPSCSRSSADVIFVSFDSDGAGTWYVRKEVVDYRPLEMVLANRERRHGVSIVYLSNRTTGEWIWTSEKWIVDQSGDYAEVMIGSGIMLWLTREHCDM